MCDRRLFQAHMHVNSLVQKTNPLEQEVPAVECLQETWATILSSDR
jgi:hypothetical protein